MGLGVRRLVVLSFALLALAPAAAQADTLEVVGKSNLGGGGLNGQVVTVGNIAVVGSGILGGSGARTSYYSSYPCPATTVKIVDVSDPSAPAVKSEIPIQPLAVPNDVDALRVKTPTFDGVLLAVALVRCQPSTAGNATERGVAYYDITNPSNPVFLSRFNPDENFFKLDDPPCSISATTRCASSNDNVSLVQREDGTVLSLSTEPASSNSQGLISSPPSTPTIIVAGCQGAGTGTGCSYRGDVRIVDVTNPTTPTYVGSFPNHSALNGGVEQRPEGYTPPGGVAQRQTFSNNGCRNYQYGLSVGVQNGNRALVPFLDAGLYTVDITNPAAPETIGRWRYATDRELEGNAAYVDFIRSGGRDLALIGENDWTGVTSTLRIDGASAVAGSKFACEAMPTLFDPQNTAQVYRQPNQEIPGEIVYVGRGCPGDVPPGSPSIAGKIAFRDLARQADREPAAGTNCSGTAAALNLQNLGAKGVVVGNTSLVTVSPQAISQEGDHSVPPNDLTIPIYMIDTGDATALRNALCPPPVAPATGCAAGGITLSGAMVDSKGEWGNLRVVDVTNPDAPTLRGTYRPAPSTVFPPPDLGVYAVHHAVGGSGSTAFVAGHSNGVRAIDLSSPDPIEIASFVPPDTVDPTGSIPAKANVVGIDVAENGTIVASDMNSGLYVLRLTPPAAATPPPPIAPPPPPPPPPSAKIAAGKGKLSATVTPSRDLKAPYVFRTRGKLTLPTGVTQAQGCSGKVRVRVLRGTKAISTRTVSLSKTCTYSVRTSFANRRKLGTAKRLGISVRFLGNTRVLAVSAKTRFARIRR
jgi:hypothetical protein